MKYTKTLKISKKEDELIRKYLTRIPKNESECFGENDSFTRTVKFDDGMEMDIKLCGVEFLDDSSNLPYTEAVLFKNGSEVSCSDACDNFTGEWELENGKNTYVAIIEVAA